MCLPRVRINLTPVIYYSSIRQPLTTQATTTRLAKPLRTFIGSVGSQNGARRNNNCRRFIISLYLIFPYLINWIKFRCLGHVVNLGNVDIMKNITKIAVVENTTSIWEYDPSRPDNRVLGGSLDVIAAIRTLAIKVCFN